MTSLRTLGVLCLGGEGFLSMLGQRVHWQAAELHSCSVSGYLVSGSRAYVYTLQPLVVAVYHLSPLQDYPKTGKDEPRQW